MNTKDKLDLYWKAKEAYYNGEEIISDLEFDTLEKELGLENKSKVGSLHNPSYTVQHPIIMGSLSKVQIHKDDDGNIDWKTYINEITSKYVYRNKTGKLIITPKYDGCSFEAHIKDNEIISSSTRGDGEYGKDIKHIISKKIPGNMVSIDKECIYRGEVLIDKQIFKEKYSEEFVNPRSFVSGILNSDEEDSKEYADKVNDLSIVIYDIREFDGTSWNDQDWFEDKWMKLDKENLFPQYYKIISSELKSIDEFSNIYYEFDEYRKNCMFALDGFVIKPVIANREIQVTPRPKDCVAIKFIPMIEPTEICDIQWSLGKTGELIPIIYVNPVEMDGKQVTKCSGHNYGYLIDNKLSIGCKVILSLAGDIIPFLYKIVDNSNYDKHKINLPDNSKVEGCHLMKILDERELAKNAFINSAAMLNITDIGPSTAEKIFEYVCSEDSVTDEFFGNDKKLLTNILECKSKDIYFGTGSGKSGKNAEDSFKEYINPTRIKLSDIIKSCCFRLCGDKASEQIENQMLGRKYDFSHIPSEAYLWSQNNGSEEMRKFNHILDTLGFSIDTFKQTNDEEVYEDTRIPVALTGNPTEYATKSEFLKYHPEYRQSGSWKEIKIVFTNDVNGNTGKMKNARKYNIEIKQY